jgi:hypothetical protein
MAGAPLVGDFDGDGVPEVGVATVDQYFLFDTECDTVPRPAHCLAGGWLRWAQPFQDDTSGQSGASGFDFDGDGTLEIVHADQCFVRIANGSDGRVLASAARWSATWLEYATVADANGDGGPEIIAPRSALAGTGPGCPPVDGQLEGPACSGSRPCPTSLYECVDGVCRASSSNDIGVVVYRERDGRWVGTRPGWNMYDYRVTHVRDDATIPATGAWMPNFASPGRNDFRVNVAGAPREVNAVDFTIRDVDGWTCDGAPSQHFEVDVCNRGTALADPSARVVFSSPPRVICEPEYTLALAPGDCQRFVCDWDDAPAIAVPIVVEVDPGAQLQCETANDRITLACD